LGVFNSCGVSSSVKNTGALLLTDLGNFSDAAGFWSLSYGLRMAEVTALQIGDVTAPNRQWAGCADGPWEGQQGSHDTNKPTRIHGHFFIYK